MNPNSLNNLMKEAQKMQQKMQEAQKELTALRVTGTGGGNMVQVTMNGRHEVDKIDINPELMDEGHEIIGEIVAAAFNDAVRKVENESQKKIGALTSGLNVPGSFTDKED